MKSFPGTDEDWTTNPTLANLLKRCNPDLLGGSTGVDSAVIPSGEGHGFNVAVRWVKLVSLKSVG